jgi:hypothetical protein
MREPRVYPRPYNAYDSDDMHLHGQGDDEPFEQSFVVPRAHSSDSANPQPNTILACPKCYSSCVDARHRARKTGGAIGAVAGTTSSIAFARSGAETGAVVDG